VLKGFEFPSVIGSKSLAQNHIQYKTYEACYDMVPAGFQYVEWHWMKDLQATKHGHGGIRRYGDGNTEYADLKKKNTAIHRVYMYNMNK
jgi:hypothetical protein